MYSPLLEERQNYYRTRILSASEVRNESGNELVHYEFLNPGTGPQRLRTSLFLLEFLLLSGQIIKVLKLFRFSTDHN